MTATIETIELTAGAGGDRTQRSALMRLLRTRSLTPNVPAFCKRPVDHGSRTLCPAPPWLRAITQNLIDDVEDHRHLRNGRNPARVLVLLESSTAIARKIARGERFDVGRARKCNGLQMLLAAGLAETEGPADRDEDEPIRYPGFDFVVELSANYLDAIGLPAVLREAAEAAEAGKADMTDMADMAEMVGALRTSENAPPIDLAGWVASVPSRRADVCATVDAVRKTLALIDHQLMHCSAKIAGQWVARSEVDRYASELGERHVETCDDVQNADGDVLVRFYALDTLERYQWTVRKHDLEEFGAVVGRWGAWNRQLGQLVDVLIDRDPLPLFDGDDVEPRET